LKTHINSPYNDEFICNLLKEVEDKIAFVTNRDYKNSQYDLGILAKASDYTDLIDLSNILDRILKCNSCYSDIKIEDVVSLAKTKLNSC
jgi:hypothetical protein